MADNKMADISFSIGTDKKMGMSLDDIIKSTKKTKQTKEKKVARPVGKAAMMRNTATKAQKAKDFSNSIAQRGKNLRQDKINKMRGITTESKPNTRIARPNTAFAVRKHGVQKKATQISSWAKQQQSRKHHQMEKIQEYNRKNPSNFSQTANRPANSNVNQGGFQIRVAKKVQSPSSSFRTQSFRTQSMSPARQLLLQRRSTPTNRNQSNVTVRMSNPLGISSNNRFLNRRGNNSGSGLIVTKNGSVLTPNFRSSQQQQQQQQSSSAIGRRSGNAIANSNRNVSRANSNSNRNNQQGNRNNQQGNRNNRGNQGKFDFGGNTGNQYQFNGFEERGNGNQNQNSNRNNNKNNRSNQNSGNQGGQSGIFGRNRRM